MPKKKVLKRDLLKQRVTMERKIHKEKATKAPTLRVLPADEVAACVRISIEKNGDSIETMLNSRYWHQMFANQQFMNMQDVLDQINNGADLVVIYRNGNITNSGVLDEITSIVAVSE